MTTTTNESVWDCVVLGLGGVGSFALRAVARDTQKSKILGLERFTVGHSKGSTHGKSRLYRKAYFEHASYVPWCQYSEQEFQALEKSSAKGGLLLEECGVLVVAPKSHPWIESCLASAAQHGIPTETIPLDQLKRRFPQYSYDTNSEQEEELVGVFEPGGGLVRPERAVQAALQEATDKYGATIWENCQVQSIEEMKDGVGEDYVVKLVVTKQNNKSSNPETTIIKARKVLLGAGAWTSEVLPTWAPHLKPIRIIQSWIDTSAIVAGEDAPVQGHKSSSSSSLYSVSKMPCAVIVNPSTLPIPVYCLPADPDADGDDDDDQEGTASSSTSVDKYKTCVKIGIHDDGSGQEPVDPNQNHLMKVTSNEQGTMDASIRAAFNSQVSAQLPCMETKPCMYTMTQDEHFVIGVPKGYTNVCAVAGLSGHGFKMTPALGQMLADFATGKGLSHWEADFCSPKRFET